MRNTVCNLGLSLFIVSYFALLLGYTQLTTALDIPLHFGAIEEVKKERRINLGVFDDYFASPSKFIFRPFPL